MKSLISRTSVLCFLTFYLSGCSILKTQEEPINDSTVDASILHEHHMVLIDNIEQFALTGRLGVMTNPKGFSGRVAWQHTPDKDNIDVFSPLGGKVANIIKTNEEVVLTNSKDEHIAAPDTETLTEETLGFRLPLNGLSYWALGRPSNTGLVEYVTWDENGRINQLKQNDWDIQYLDYEVNEGYFLPKKIVLRTDELIIKLIVEKWSDIQTR
ncbi:MAG: lipoprotein insertase outer membrane protein LolB [Betaproteobacteria bacterium]|nr:lipoprotein insertase outer membrane protein LolB [Betaproteobacteria bacterium]MCH9849274.1 lipoprotein insertase outer membrane protein LolB [Betaproteobacteria bacterium]